MLNKTQKDNHAKTVLGRKLQSRLLPAVILGIVLIGSVFAALFSAYELSCFESYRHDKSLSVAGETIKLEVADTLVTRERGLSDRRCIKSDQAMLFVFEEHDTSDHCFWMKDMRFPIDMVWLDHDKRVVFSASEVEPATYPQNYCPNMPTRYVLEFKSGRAKELGIGYDKALQF